MRAETKTQRESIFPEEIIRKKRKLRKAEIKRQPASGRQHNALGFQGEIPLKIIKERRVKVDM